MNKKRVIIYFLLIVNVHFCSYSQEVITPEKVSKEARHAIQTKYPTVKEFNWKQDKRGNYIVSFIDKNKKQKTIINVTQNGIILNNISYNNLPINIRKIISQEVKPTEIKRITIGGNKKYDKIYLIETNNKKIFISSDEKILFKFCY